MKSTAATPDAWITGLPDDRRPALEAVRAVILANLPAGYEESVAFGMLAYSVPLSVYPDTYNKQPLMYAALGNQKGHMAVYLTNVYGSPELRARFEEGYRKAGKKLDMGKTCVRFKKLADVPLAVIGEAIAATPMAEFVAFAKALQKK
ncbi:MAG: DUF1801 domain-containing protein [Polyangiales bacterium]